MSRKFSIIASVNLEKINKETYEYIRQNGGLEPYLFMSEETANAVETEVGMHDVIFRDDSLLKKYAKNGVYATYSGYKVFVNNDLKFGIVEIR